MRKLKLILILQMIFLLPAFCQEVEAPPQTLHKAIYQEDLEQVRELLNSGVDPNAIDPWSGYTPLHYAAFNDQIKIARILVRRRADLDSFGQAYVAPIHIAAASNSTQVLKYLIIKGASIHLKDREDGYTPIIHAAKHGNLECVRLLLKHGASLEGSKVGSEGSIFSPDITPLDIAAQESHLDVVRYLYSKGASYSIHQAATAGDLPRVCELVEENPDSIYSQDESSLGGRKRPLHHAATQGHLDIVQYLIAKGAKVNIYDMIGRTALHYAADEGHLVVARFLIEKGAKINRRDAWKFTPLILAVAEEDWELADLLLDKGANPQTVCEFGQTPLYLAIEKGNPDMARRLIEHGAEYDINAAAAIGDVSRVAELIHTDPTLLKLSSPLSEPPLHLACRHGHLQLAKFLLSQGADIDQVSFGGFTALHYAILEGHEDIVSLLLASGADPIIEGAVGNALHQAIEADQVAIVMLLLEHGMNPDRTTETLLPGWTPLHFTAVSGNTEIARLLIQAGADINAVNGRGQSVLSMAEDCKKTQFVDYLISLGAKRNPPVQQPPATLHELVDKGDLNSIRKNLSEHPETIDSRNESGKTPLHLAAENGNKEIVQLLLTFTPIIDATVGMPQPPKSLALFPEIVSEESVSATQAESHFEKGMGIMPGMAFPSRFPGEEDLGKTALYLATEKDHESIVRLLIENGADIENKNYRGLSPLELALQEGNFKIARMLVEAGADVNHRSGYSREWPLTQAAKTGNRKLVKLLLDHGAEVNPGDMSGFPLAGAVKSHNLKIVRLLLDRGAAIIPDGTYFFSAIHTAADEEQTNMLKLFLQKGADINSKGSSNTTPLHCAVRGGHIKTTTFLLSQDADIKAQDYAGDTPLHIAVSKGNVEMVKLLLKQGANVNAEAEFKITPLHYTCRPEDEDVSIQIAQILLDAGADINAKTEYDGITPLEYAREEMSFGITPIHYAAHWGRTKLIEFLDKQGADIRAKSTTNITPLHFASESMFTEETIEYLLEHGADIHAKTTDTGQTPLHFAVQTGNFNTLELLIEHGADPHKKDFSGNTPLDLAREHRNSNAIIFLEDLLAEEGKL